MRSPIYFTEWFLDQTGRQEAIDYTRTLDLISRFDLLASYLLTALIN
jgi:hypothetical protein